MDARAREGNGKFKQNDYRSLKPYSDNRLGQRRHSSQRSWDIHLQYPSKTGSGRYFSSSPHQPRGRDTDLPRIPTRCHQKPNPRPQEHRSWAKTSFKMYHQHLFAARPQSGNRCGPVRCVQGWTLRSNAIAGC